jgi:uncharacterized protein YuzE
MRVTYDPDARAAYIYLTGSMQPGEAKRTISATDQINLDFDAEGRLIGIELLDPALLHPKLLPQAGE